MGYVEKRRRGTAIVETRKGILVVSGRRRIFITPGGGANKNESRKKAAIRELREETGLRAYSSRYLFRYIGGIHKSKGGGYFQDYHTVFLVKAKGNARPRHEVKHIAYYKPSSNVKISRVTKEIVERYYNYKQNKMNKKLDLSFVSKIKYFFR